MNFKANWVLALLSASLLLAACDGNADGEGGSGGETSQGGNGGTAGSGGNGGSTTATEQGGNGGTDKVTAEIFAKLDPAAFELPEGLAVDGDTAYVGYAFTGAIETLDLKTGDRKVFANAPQPPPNTSFMTGVGKDASGQIHAAYVSFTPDAAPGIYRAKSTGGEATLWASHPDMVFPNGLAWDDKGALFVTDAAFGGVMKVAADGTVTPWVQDDLLKGDPPACGEPADALAIGANGLVWTKDALLVASTDQGLIAKVAISPDGTAGAVSVLAGPDCENLAGVDGIVADTDGSIIGAVNRSNKLVRIGKDGSANVLFEGAPLDFPASVAFGGEGAERALYVTSFALGNFLSGGQANPAIVKVKLP